MSVQVRQIPIPPLSQNTKKKKKKKTFLLSPCFLENKQTMRVLADVDIKPLPLLHAWRWRQPQQRRLEFNHVYILLLMIQLCNCKFCNHILSGHQNDAYTCR